jgi:hypothetical protein
MSCWVVPTLAAELWRLPLDQVLQRMKEGLVPTKREDGWTFIDVAPASPRVGQPSLPPEQRPPTFTLVQSDQTPSSADDLEAAELAALKALTAAASDPEMLSPVDEVETGSLGDWRVARARNARMRIPPSRAST